jgi:hypothetical protein
MCLFGLTVLYVLYCIVLYLLYCNVLYCTVLYIYIVYTVLYIVLCTVYNTHVLYCTVLYCTYCTVMYCTVLYCTYILYIQYCILCCVLYITHMYYGCTVLYCTVLYCTVLYCTVLHMHMHTHSVTLLVGHLIILVSGCCERGERWHRPHLADSQCWQIQKVRVLHISMWGFELSYSTCFWG